MNNNYNHPNMNGLRDERPSVPGTVIGIRCLLSGSRTDISSDAHGNDYSLRHNDEAGTVKDNLSKSRNER